MELYTENKVIKLLDVQQLGLYLLTFSFDNMKQNSYEIVMIITWDNARPGPGMALCSGHLIFTKDEQESIKEYHSIKKKNKKVV